MLLFPQQLCMIHTLILFQYGSLSALSLQNNCVLLSVEPACSDSVCIKIVSKLFIYLLWMKKDAFQHEVTELRREVVMVIYGSNFSNKGSHQHHITSSLVNAPFRVIGNILYMQFFLCLQQQTTANVHQFRYSNKIILILNHFKQHILIKGFEKALPRKICVTP